MFTALPTRRYFSSPPYRPQTIMTLDIEMKGVVAGVLRYPYLFEKKGGSFLISWWKVEWAYSYRSESLGYWKVRDWRKPRKAQFPPCPAS
jgi:hypothetical protein